MSSAETLTQLKKSVKDFKSHFERATKSAIHLCDFIKHKPSSLSVTELKDIHQELKQTYKKLKETYQKIEELDTKKSYDSILDDIMNSYENTIQHIIENISTIEASPGPTVAQPDMATQNAPRIKVNNALKPFILTRDHTPTEFRSWIEKFKAFYSLSNLEQCSLAEQHAYFRICIDVNLESRIREKIMENTPIFGDDGCVALLEEGFLLKYPLFAH